MKKNIHSKNDKIRLFYFDNGNLGDILSGFLIENLTLRKVDLQYPITLSKFFKNLISFLITLIRYRGNYKLAKKGFTFSFKPTIIAIGSLIEHSTYTCKVWGTGMGQPRLIPSGGRFIMTRGYLSRHILMNAGFKVESHICGDPALLMPLLYNPFAKIIKNRGGVGVISNMINYEDLKIIFGNSIEFEVINMMTLNVEETIDKITSCKFIYSCSLHGLILSHAYGIPCIWFQDRIRSDDYFRFIDHLSAVDIKFYKPLSLQDVKARKRLGDKYEMISKKKLHIIQKELLNRAPFTINNSIILNLIKNDKWENKD